MTLNELIITLALSSIVFFAVDAEKYILEKKQRNQAATTDAMVSWTDITPTILDYAGALPAKNDFHGRSFKSTRSAVPPTARLTTKAYENTQLTPSEVLSVSRFAH